MNALEADKIETDVGAFLLMKRKNWTFSENCLAMKATLEEAQATEQADGTATFVESVTVSFRGK